MKRIIFLLMVVLVCGSVYGIAEYPAANHLNATHHLKLNDDYTDELSDDDAVFAGGDGGEFVNSRVGPDFGKSLLADTDHNQLNITDNKMFNNNMSASMSLWMEFTDTSGNNYFISHSGHTSINPGTSQWGLIALGTNTLYGFIGFDSGNQQQQIDFAGCGFSDNVIYHVAMTMRQTGSGINMTIYLNGTKCGSNTFASQGGALEAIDFAVTIIESGLSPNEEYFGYLDEILFFPDMELTQEQVTELYEGSYPVSDIYPPSVTLGVNDTTPQIDYNVSVNVNSSEAGNCWVYDNMSNSNTSQVACNATFTYLVNLTKGNTILFNAYAEDSFSNLNDSETTTVTVLNTAPPIVTTFNVSDGRRVNNNETISWTAVGDADADTVLYTVWFNDTGGWYNHTSTTDNFFVLNLTSESTFNYKVQTFDGEVDGANSSAYTVELDTTGPIITWYSPTMTTYTQYDSYLVNITCTDLNEIWSINITTATPANSSQRDSWYSYNYSGASSVNNVSNMSLHFSSQHVVSVYCYDAHSGKPINDLKKGKKGEAELVFNDTVLDQYLDVKMYFIEKVDKLTDTPGDLYTTSDYMDKFDNYVDQSDATKIKFGSNFTVLKPETKIVYNLSSNYPIFYLDHSSYSGHFIWGEYVTDFASADYVYVNGVKKLTVTTVTIIDTYNVEVKIEGLEQWLAGDVITIDPEAQRLNLVSEAYTIYHDANPQYFNLTNNASDQTYLNGAVNISVRANDTYALSDYQIIRHNSTGTWQEFNESQPEGIASTQYIDKIITPTLAHSYVCANFTIYDIQTGSVYSAYTNLINHTAMTCFDVQNSIPTLPTLLTPINATTEYDNTTGFDWSDSTDADSDTLYYSLTISNGSDFSYTVYNNTNISGSTYTLTDDEALEDGTYYWRVNLTDGYNNTNNTGFFQYSVNTSFGISSQAKNCTLCYNDGDIEFNMTLSNAGVDVVKFHSNYTGSWINYTGQITNITLDYYYTVMAGNLTNQEVIGWHWTANNSGGSEVSGILQSFTVDNRAPTHNSPLLNSSDALNLTTSDLTCYFFNITDIDGDALNYYYTWYNDGIELTALDDLSVVSSTNTSQGEDWICEIIVGDSYDNSTARNSTTLRVIDQEFPTWLMISNNASNATTVPGVVNWSVYISDNVALSSYIFSYNDTGIWIVDSAVAITGNTSNISVEKMIYLENSYICGNFSFNDTQNNWNTTELSCFRSLSSASSQLDHLTYESNATLLYLLNISRLYINRSRLTLTGYHADNFTSHDGDSAYNFTGLWTAPDNLIDNSCSSFATVGEVDKYLNYSKNYTINTRDYNLEWEIRSKNNWTNLTLTSCDRSSGAVHLEIRGINRAVGLVSGSEYFCKDSGGDWLLLLNDSQVDGDPKVYCENLWGNFRSYVSEINITIDDQLHYYNSSEWNLSNTPVTINLNETLLNTILQNGCSCTDCVATALECYAPLYIYSATRGVLEFTETDIHTLVGINNCSGSVIPTNATAINFTIYEENNLTALTADVQGTFNYFALNTTLDLADVNEFLICVYPTWASFDASAYFQYEPENGYRERYYLNNLTISNATQQVYMYNFGGTTGLSELTAISYTYDYDYYSGLITKLQRYYPAENLWRTVQIDQADEFGQSLFYIYQNTYDYKLLFEESGLLIDQTVPLKFICDSATECEQTFIVEGIPSEVDWSGMSYYSLYNNDTEVMTVTWSDPSNTVDDVRILVEQLRGDRIVDVCDTTVTATSGTIICNTSGYDGVLSVRLFRAASPSVPFYQETIEKLTAELNTILQSSGYPKAGAFFSMLIMLAVAGFGIAGTIPSIISGLVGLIIIHMLGLNSWVTYSFIISGICVGVLVAYVISKKKR